MGLAEEEEGEEGKVLGEGQGKRKGQGFWDRKTSKCIHRGGRRFRELETREPQRDGDGRCRRVYMILLVC